LAELEQGLLLVTGVSGSGKSSTVAAMLNHINQNLHRHIVTVENPIEFLHRDVKCSVTQREVGVDTDSFAVGLQAALRQDPDVIVIGEIADSETLDTAIKAAERGHLVISTLPTPDVVSTVSRIHSMFPAVEREIGTIRLSEVLRGVVAQRLLPRKDEGGRVVAVEVLTTPPAVRAILRDPERLGALRVVMTEGTDDGMQTLEQDAARLLESGAIAQEAAAALGGSAPTPVASASSSRKKS
ncbi:MAG TPA: ATPase, T2SS/T4P/T4SS family, partial [Gemmatimonadales bacterium]|nr:ATPase, T2SS/T4P/T4SS family [Gemmatimonadales bacterium]